MATSAVTRNVRIFKTENAFIWAFAIGIVMISVAKLIAKGHPIPGGFIASGLGIMVMWRYQSVQKRIHPDSEQPRLGDEIYYLGLLYTLTSLCAALVSLFLVFGGEQTLEERTDEMIGSFGIALFTTMAGIVMRVNLQRHSTERRATIIRIPHSPGDPDGGDGKIKGVMIDLERYAYELRRQLQNSTNAFASHANQAILQAKTIHGHMDEMMQTFHHGLEEKANTQLKSLKTIYNDVAKKAEEAKDRTAAQQAGIRNALEKLETQVKAMDASIERIRVGSGATAENLEAIGTQASAMAQAFAQSGKTIADGVNTLTEVIDSEKEVHEVRKQFAQETGEQLKRQAEEWSSVQQRAGEALKDMAQTNEALSRMGHEAQRTNVELAALPEGITRARQSIERLAEIENASNAISGLEAKAKTLTEQLSAVVTTGTRHEQALEGTIKKLHTLAELAGQEFDGRAKLKEAAGEIVEVVSTAGLHAKDLKDTEREITRINEGLQGVRVALQEEGLKLAEVLRQTVDALGEAKVGRSSIFKRIFGRKGTGSADGDGGGI